TLADVVVVTESDRRSLGRPWLTLAIDVATRMVVGFHLSLDKPSAVAVALVLSQVVLPKDRYLAGRGVDLDWPVSGLPQRLHLDNAKEFRSQALRRGASQYGIEIDYRPPATPHFGGHIERLIGTMMGALRILPGATGRSVAERGDDPEGTAVLSLDELETWLVHQIAGVYHHTLHSSLGKPPITAWREAV
ncbi:transposase family protein, partial [Acidisoma silvae]